MNYRFANLVVAWLYETIVVFVLFIFIAKKQEHFRMWKMSLFPPLLLFYLLCGVLLYVLELIIFPQFTLIFFFEILTLVLLNPELSLYVNTVDPDQMASKEESHLTSISEPGFNICFENSEDPDQMASEEIHLIRIQTVFHSD